MSYFFDLLLRFFFSPTGSLLTACHLVANLVGRRIGQSQVVCEKGFT